MDQGSVSPSSASLAFQNSSLGCTDQQVNQESFRQYARFRENLLRLNQGNGAVINDNELDDISLEQRRKKNNEAAKRSRDSRRAKEDEIAIRAAFLEQENLSLKWELNRLKADISKLRHVLLAPPE